LLIGPRDRNHACDLTDIELVLKETGNKMREWTLTRDVADSVLAGNPHDDRFGNEGVWHFYTEPEPTGEEGRAVPSRSLLARWLSADQPDEKSELAQDLQTLLTNGPPADAKHPDSVLRRQLASLSGPLFGKARPKQATSSEMNESTLPGLDPALFGKHPN